LPATGVTPPLRTATRGGRGLAAANGVSGSELRPWAGTGLLVLAVLLTIAARPLDRATNVNLAAAAAIAMAVRALLALPSLSGVLGGFASSLDLLVELGLVLAAARVTGGLSSPVLAIAGANIVLTRRYQGPAAARFLALVTVLGLGLVATTGGPPFEPVSLALRALWPLALLVSIELALPAAERREEADSSPPAPLDARPLAAAALATIPPAAAPPAARAAAPRTGSPASPVATGSRPPGPERRTRDRDVRSEILHDLRSPLSVVRVYADLVAERLHNLTSEIELMELLVEGAAARRGQGTRAGDDLIDLVKMARALAGRYRQAHGDKVRIQTQIERPIVSVRADPVALQRVFRNVLDNAVQYTPPGGEVQIRVGADEAHAHVIVSDNGIGMSEEDRAHAFDYAFRGRTGQALHAAGRGVGLALSRELVESLGGSISLWSEEDRGSEIRIVLPVAMEVRS
jgi:signal transduction histidine kinase